jgi:methylated-DNA-protein-cysteine methyltransferase related protein
MDQPLTAKEKIWQVVAAIPSGKVASYGQVARLAGLGRGARQVGHTLRELPQGSKLPWHRVVNSQGRISLPPGSEGAQLQRGRLEDEGIEFTLAGKIHLSLFGWDI